jgi:hypothetical protein
MISRYERWVGHIELSLSWRGRLHAGLSLKDALSVISKLPGSPASVSDDGRWIVQLASLKLNWPQTDFATLLFLGIDRDSAAAVYGNTRTFDLREAVKRPDEGGAVSAHLVVSLVPNQSGACPAALEETVGLGRTKVIGFLRRAIRDHVVFYDNEPDGSKTAIEPGLEASAVLDEPLGAQLERTRIVAVEMVKRTKLAIDDGLDDFDVRYRSVHLKPSVEASGSQARAIISRLVNTDLAKEYPEIRVKIADSDQNTRTVRAHTDRMDALTAAFQKFSLINDINPPLQWATNQPIPHFCRKIIRMIK